MADYKAIAKLVLNTGKELVKDEDFVTFLCGKYSDGTNRKVRDAIKGEYLSPKEKKKAMSKKTKKSKKKNKSTKFKL